MLQIELDCDFEQKLDAICSMVGTFKTKVAMDALKKIVDEYCDDNGNFTPREGFLFETFRPDGTRKCLGPCFVLDELSMTGMPYYKLYWDGKLIKAPQYCVKIATDAPGQGPGTGTVPGGVVDKSGVK